MFDTPVRAGTWQLLAPSSKTVTIQATLVDGTKITWTGTWQAQNGPGRGTLIWTDTQ